MKFVVADRYVLAQKIEEIRNDLTLSFDFAENAETETIDYYNCTVGQKFETEEYSSWYQMKYLDIADGNYIIVGYYGGGYAETYNLDEYTSAEIATMIFMDTFSIEPEKIFIEQ